MYVRDGRLPPGIAHACCGEQAFASSDVALVVHERHFVNYEGMIMEAKGTVQPARVREREGVPLVTVYLKTPPRPPAREARTP
jgi:hypothetical protein